MASEQFMSLGNSRQSMYLRVMSTSLFRPRRHGWMESGAWSRHGLEGEDAAFWGTRAGPVNVEGSADLEERTGTVVTRSAAT
jgi:hypothetical protein